MFGRKELKKATARNMVKRQKTRSRTVIESHRPNQPRLRPELVPTQVEAFATKTPCLRGWRWKYGLGSGRPPS
jgi:hypothetical protein